MKKMIKLAIGACLFALPLAGALTGFAADTWQMSPPILKGPMYDSHYVTMMIQHDKRGLELARLGQERAQDTRVKDLAQRVIDQRQIDIEELQDYANALQPATTGQALPEMESTTVQEDMDKLGQMQGADFDNAFLDALQRHEGVSLDWSTEAAKKADSAQIRDFAARDMVKQQTELRDARNIKASLAKPEPKLPY